MTAFSQIITHFQSGIQKIMNATIGMTNKFLKIHVIKVNMTLHSTDDLKFRKLNLEIQRL